MTRVALDSNILIYAEVEPETKKGRRAVDVILRAARDGVIPVQVLGEYLRFIQRRAPAMLEMAIERSGLYRQTFLAPPTTEVVLQAAAELARAHQLQVWDGVVCAAAAQAGASVILTEDMQDGRSLAGLRLINPFASTNDAAVEAALTG